MRYFYQKHSKYSRINHNLQTSRNINSFNPVNENHEKIKDKNSNQDKSESKIIGFYIGYYT